MDTTHQTPASESTLKGGDVIEFTHHGVRQTAEVMLITEDDLVLLDLFDEERPVHARVSQLVDVAIFSPDLVAA